MNLNLIFDQWSNNEPLPNGVNFVQDPNTLKLPHSTFNFYKIKNYLNHNTKEVSENTNIKYFYFINYKVSIIDSMIKLKKLILSEEMVNLMKSNSNVFIVYMCEHEPESDRFFKILKAQSNELGLDQKRFYILNNNSKINEYNREMGTEFNTHYLKFLPKFYSKIFNPYKNLPFTIDKKGKFMMCHNKMPKPHRYGLLVLLKKYNLLDEIDWSLVMGESHKKQNSSNDFFDFYQNIFDSEEIKTLKHEIDFINNIDVKKSDYEYDKKWFDNEYNRLNLFTSHSIEPNTLVNSYINCITESVYRDYTIHITEKTIKPFFFYQIPIFLSSYNHVTYLKRLYGFDLFEDVINHEYDTIKDNKVRLTYFIKEIKRLFENKKNIIQFYGENQERFERNKKIVCDLTKEESDITFFKSLMSAI